MYTKSKKKKKRSSMKHTCGFPPSQLTSYGIFPLINGSMPLLVLEKFVACMFG